MFGVLTKRKMVIKENLKTHRVLSKRVPFTWFQTCPRWTDRATKRRHTWPEKEKPIMWSPKEGIAIISLTHGCTGSFIPKEYERPSII